MIDKDRNPTLVAGDAIEDVTPDGCLRCIVAEIGADELKFELNQRNVQRRK